jgi:hypothetical protein
MDNMHLTRSITSLEAPLNAALNQLIRSNDAAACNILDAFLYHVNANEANGRLTSQHAADLRQLATSVETSLDC